MIKALIIEDEFLVRVGLKTFISWAEEGYELIGEASNGIEALQILEHSPCDLLLTDIQMPEMDGLTLLQHVKEKYPSIKSIILSNHDDFKYVRTALQIGALDYVLKLTMEPQELVHKLRGVRKQILQERSEMDHAQQISTKLILFQTEIRERRFYDILTKACSRKEIEDVLQEFHFPEQGPYRVVNIQIDHYRQVLEENKFKSEKLLILTVANIMAEILKGRYEGELVLLEAGRFSLLVPNYSEAMLEELKDNIKRYLKLDVNCGISRAFDDIYPVHAAFVEANEALSFNFSKGERKIAYFDRLKIAPEIQWVADLIKEQYASNIKLSDLARSVGYSESYLSVLYKKETGETIMDSITRRRLEKAKELLKDKALKIYEISEAIGYSDPNYFGKFFKKAEGMYPQEYRKRYFNM